MIIAVIVALSVLPLVFSAFAAQRQHADQSITAFLTNAGRNGFVATLAGAICGNVGVGSFIAIYLFTSQSPIIGFSIAAAYSLGLIICALIAPVIRRRAGQVGAVGLIDLIAVTHGTPRRAVIWLPVAFVFVLRSAVQLGALSVLTADLLGGSPVFITLLMAFLIGLYLVFGGYRAAVQTDIVQSVVIVGAILFAIPGLQALPDTPVPFFNVAPYQPAILVGIWLFIPWSAVLAVDNWQRITVATSNRVAQGSYLLAALVCGMVFGTIALAGYWSDGASVYAMFNALMPQGLGWVAVAMFVACIMSSIDTFIMPLMSGLSGHLTLGRLRVIVAGLVMATACLAIVFGDLLGSIIAAFNTLAVFLPAAFGALFFPNAQRFAAGASMSIGLIIAVSFTFVDVNSAALVGFVVALVTYFVPAIWRTAWVNN